MKISSLVLALLALTTCSSPSPPLEPGDRDLVPFAYDPPRDCLALGVGAERAEEDDAITLTLSLKNVCTESLWLNGDGEPAHDFFLLNEAGEAVWRWRTSPVLDIFETFTLKPSAERLLKVALDSTELNRAALEHPGETLRLVGYYDGGTEWGDERETQPRPFTLE